MNCGSGTKRTEHSENNQVCSFDILQLCTFGLKRAVVIFVLCQALLHKLREGFIS